MLRLYIKSMGGLGESMCHFYFAAVSTRGSESPLVTTE
jgi:hypothetical protein